MDDRFTASRKFSALRRSEWFEAAVAVWAATGSWAAGDASAKEDGVVPLDVVASFGFPNWEMGTKELVRVGLWEDLSDDAIGFHDWGYWNGPHAKAKRLEKRLEADRVRQQNRRSEGWSQDSHVTNPGHVSDSNVTRGKGYGLSSSSTSSKSVETSTVAKPARTPKPVREDAMRICVHLADRVEANGSKRPNITTRWVDAARLLMDLDGRTEEQIHKAIDWCQNDEFWKANVMSTPTLREKYDRLRLRAIAEAEAKDAPKGPRDTPRPGSGVWDRPVNGSDE